MTDRVCLNADGTAIVDCASSDAAFVHGANDPAVKRLQKQADAEQSEAKAVEAAPENKAVERAPAKKARG